MSGATLNFIGGKSRGLTTSSTSTGKCSAVFLPPSSHDGERWRLTLQVDVVQIHSPRTEPIHRGSVLYIFSWFSRLSDLLYLSLIFALLLPHWPPRRSLKRLSSASRMSQFRLFISCSLPSLLERTDHWANKRATSPPALIPKTYPSSSRWLCPPSTSVSSLRGRIASWNGHGSYYWRFGCMSEATVRS